MTGAFHLKADDSQETFRAQGDKPRENIQERRSSERMGKLVAGTLSNFKTVTANDK